MDMFDGTIETHVEPDGSAKSKRLISDEETIRQMDFDDACEAFVRAEREWEKQDAIAKRPGARPDRCVQVVRCLGGTLPDGETSLATFHGGRPQPPLRDDLSTI